MYRVPQLIFTGDDAQAEADVPLLPGGKTYSFASVRAFDLAVLLLIPFGRNLLRAGGGRIAPATLRCAVRGWNGDQESPLPDAKGGPLTRSRPVSATYPLSSSGTPWVGEWR